MRVLIVEDYTPLRRSLAQGLREAGFAVDAAADGEEGLWYAQGNEYDVLVLDIMLPKLSGLDLLGRLRQRGDDVPVLLLTAKDTVADRVAGLDCGADDYLTKPFAHEELLARVRALARRRYSQADPVLHVGDLTIDTASREVARAELRVELTAREYALLEYLALRAGQVVTRSDIWEHLYEFHASAESNVVDVYIGYLRRKLEEGGRPRMIHTRRGQGYVLGVAP